MAILTLCLASSLVCRKLDPLPYITSTVVLILRSLFTASISRKQAAGANKNWGKNGAAQKNVIQL